MANRIYPKAREKYLTGQLDWLTDDVVVVLLSSAYEYSDAHEWATSLTGQIDTSDPMTGKTATGGVADANDVVFTALTGANVAGLALVADTGVPGTSALIAFMDSDTTSVLLDYEPDGSNARLRWSNGSLRIFRL